eukprot:281720-Pyramimonas_sp.AAC.1
MPHAHAVQMVKPPPPADDDDWPTDPPIRHERYPTRLLLIERYYGLASLLGPAAMRCAECNSPNLHGDV